MIWVKVGLAQSDLGNFYLKMIVYRVIREPFVSLGGAISKDISLVIGRVEPQEPNLKVS